MSDPRFRPRRCTSEPGAFGKADTIAWNQPVSEPDHDRILAAQMQHRYAVRISKRSRAKYGSLKGYAEAAGLNYDRLSKIIRGEALMRFEDLANAERLLGGIVGDGS
ncbi:MAG: hypothetical protein M3Y42_00625 [Actinomycetota bacterium]|nr:hypothetical protein [Actinomycetota bacterium]